jgi:hypothetical protein
MQTLSVDTFVSYTRYARQGHQKEIMILVFKAYNTILLMHTQTMGVYPSFTYLSLSHEVPLETTEENFPLAGLQSIHHGGD